MKNISGKKITLAVTIIIIIALPLLIYAEQAPQNKTNPLIDEMLVLDSAIKEIVSAVAVGDGERVRKALESAHGTMEKTHEGVHSGVVKTPRNSNRIKEFLKMDKRFHRNLERLEKAADLNDQVKMLSVTKRLLDGCVGCHRIFR